MNEDISDVQRNIRSLLPVVDMCVPEICCQEQICYGCGKKLNAPVVRGCIRQTYCGPQCYIPYVIACEECGVEFKSLEKRRTHCSSRCAAAKGQRARRKIILEKSCVICGIVFYVSGNSKKQAAKMTCSRSCSCKMVSKRPERKAQFMLRIAPTRGQMAGVPRPDASIRMRLNNPMRDPAARAKMIASNKGRTFLSRGGNGQLTRQQIAMAKILCWPMEVSIPTAAVKHMFPSLPNSYKVDLACMEMKLAIEIDGNSHTTKKWKFLDRRKTEVLNSLGGTVLRFWNKEVDRDPIACAEKVLDMSTTLR